MAKNQPLNYHTLALDVQQLTKASRNISTVLRVEGMDLEIGSRRLLREARDAINAAIADWREDMDRIAESPPSKETQHEYKT